MTKEEQWLTEMNDALWTDCTMYINPPPTPASTDAVSGLDDAIAGLIDRGCVIVPTRRCNAKNRD